MTSDNNIIIIDNNLSAHSAKHLTAYYQMRLKKKRDGGSNKRKHPVTAKQKATRNK